jgi:hypothetical protein
MGQPDERPVFFVGRMIQGVGGTSTVHSARRQRWYRTAMDSGR